MPMNHDNDDMNDDNNVRHNNDIHNNDENHDKAPMHCNDDNSDSNNNYLQGGGCAVASSQTSPLGQRLLQIDVCSSGHPLAEQTEG